MNQDLDKQEVLSLEELSLTPDWMKAPVKNYDRHPGDSGARKFGDSPRPPRDRPRESGGDRRSSGPRRDRPDRSARPAGGRPAPRPTAPPPQPLPNVELAFVPNEAVFAAMIETIKQSNRAYSLFDLAKLVLNKPERHNVKFAIKDGQLYCALLVGGVFLSQEEAIRHTLRQGEGKVFTRTEKPVDPPKGNFQFVNRCSLTGEWLGPPNYHEYQSRLVKHHQQRLAHMQFDRFKASIETVHDPEAVKAWIESKSKMTEYTCILDADPKVFVDRSELEKHVRAEHLDQLVTAVNRVELTGPMSRRVSEPRLLEVVRLAWESERRFPINTVNELRPLLVKAGLHFFKHKKGVTFITRIKLNRFESTTHLSELLQKIVAFLRTHEGATRKQLAANLAPVDETQLASDLHWLIQDGYVVEFHDGKLWALEEKPSQQPSRAPAKPVAATPPPVKSATAPASDVLPSAVGEPLPAGAVVSAPVENTPVPATNATAAPVASTPEPVNCPPQLPVETALVVDQPVITPEPAPAESVPTPAQTVSMPHDTTDTT